MKRECSSVMLDFSREKGLQGDVTPCFEEKSKALYQRKEEWLKAALNV